MLSAGSNKGIDNLLAAVTKAIEEGARLRIWCGKVVRVRTPTYQRSFLSKYESAEQAPLTGSDKAFEKYQTHWEAVKYANGRRFEDKVCVEFLDFLAMTRQCGASNEVAKAFRNRHEQILMEVLSASKIVATTLSNASHNVFHLSEKFQPDVLVCDEPGQCTEGGHMIAMTIYSIKAVVLLGDPKQLAPTIISENVSNEGALYVKRSLMERLYKAGYPSTILRTNYRNHTDILKMYSQTVYDGELMAAPQNSAPNRVGNAWDSFTSSRHHFQSFGLQREQCVFISVDGFATHQGSSLSWSDANQATAAVELLREVYQHRGPNGEQITPEDVMLISLYKDHKKEWLGISARKTVLAITTTSRSTRPRAKKRSSSFIC
jgi:ATP-dependent RNA/DNA helicase IGHMBP2